MEQYPAANDERYYPDMLEVQFQHEDITSTPQYERLLDDKEFRYTILPLKYHDIWDMYKKAQAAFWTPSEIDLSKDLSDFQKMSEDEQHYIRHVLSFFATSDTIVNMNLVEHMMTNVKIPEANYFYVFQMAIENIHSETYNLLIDTYVTDPDQKMLMFDAASRMDCVKNKVIWCEKYIDNDNISFAERLIASVAVEGIFFSSSFAALFWLKKRGLMPGLTFSNELISRDEALHCQFATLLYNKYINHKLDQQKVYEIIESAVAAELYFVQKSLPVSIIGMNSDDMQTYVKFVADYWLIQLGLAPLYRAKNPFSFMETISMDGKTNFFEKKVAEYSKYGVNTSFTTADMTFDINEDF